MQTCRTNAALSTRVFIVQQQNGQCTSRGDEDEDENDDDDEVYLEDMKTPSKIKISIS